MMKNELVSIIMPAYNSEKYVKTAIDSVLNQTYSNWELIVVDDCSLDDTFKIISNYSDDRIKIFSNEKNTGVSLTRKFALEQANGKWIALLDSDDAWDSKKLEIQMMFQEKNDADLLFTASAFMDDDGNRLKWVQHAPDQLKYRQLLKQNILSNSSALIRTDLYKNNLVLDDTLHEDFACWLNVMSNGIVAYGIDEPLLIYRLANSSRSSKKFRALLMNWRTYRYAGLNYFETLYYMIWSTIKSVVKYSKLDRLF